MSHGEIDLEKDYSTKIEKRDKIKGESWNHLEPGEPGNKQVYRVCGDKNRNEGPNEFCQLRSGYRTNHPGMGRCYLHGGRSAVGIENGRFTTGTGSFKYQQEMRRAFIDKGQNWEEYGNPTELYAELEVQRHLLYMFLARSSREHDLGMGTVDELLMPTGEAVPIDGLKKLDMEFPDTIRSAFGMVKEIKSVAQAITKQQKDIALTMAEVKYMREVLRETFERFIPDEDTRKQALQFFAERVGR